MTAEGLINVCQAVSHGIPRQVRNLKTDQQGTVMSVEGGSMTVVVGQSSVVWPCEDCLECTI
ncbi:MAG: hypothetical protein C0614_11195 [Desulfuromonas sp.]|nr:MAG: hypothetical protein C0614_11195 [Desulfuromonas sp.]